MVAKHCRFHYLEEVLSLLALDPARSVECGLYDDIDKDEDACCLVLFKLLGAPD